MITFGNLKELIGMTFQLYTLQIFSLAPLLIAGVIVILIFVSVKRLKEVNMIKSVEKNLAKNEFIFKLPYGHLIITLIAFPILGWLNLENHPLMLFLYGFIFIVTILSFVANKEIYTFHEDSIVNSKRQVLLSMTDITGLTITSDEVNFHTAKFINHHTFKATKLIGKSWLEFQQAAEEFAAQHEHIELEKT